jgi:lambda repressor-like predicted transcriptional regulator
MHKQVIKITLKKLGTEIRDLGFNYGNTNTAVYKGLNHRYKKHCQTS